MSDRLVTAVTLSVAMLALLALDAPLLAGGGLDADASAAVSIIARDYSFTGPDRIPAGLTTIQVTNEGHDLHHVQLIRLLDGKTPADFAAAMKANPSQSPSWVKFMGGPNAVVPGGTATATMNLVEGDYLLLCVIPDTAGTPHVALGMLKRLAVDARSTVAVSEPKTAGTITLVDFQFGVPDTIPAGRHTLAVTNQGAQPHEVVVVQLAPGASVLDFAKAFEPGASGPPPGKPIGGVVGIEHGDRAYFTTDFVPGRYGVICFFPDPVSGLPHFARGMSAEFSVK